MPEEKKECNCDFGVHIGYLKHHGIERKVMRCKGCHQILDYYPQYCGDDLNADEPVSGASIKLNFLNKDIELFEAPYKILSEYLSKKK